MPGSSALILPTIPVLSVSNVFWRTGKPRASWRMYPAIIVLGISTILNAVYFMKTVLRIYTPISKEEEAEKGFIRISWNEQKIYTVAIVLFIVVNVFLGTNSKPIIQLIEEGLRNFM